VSVPGAGERLLELRQDDLAAQDPVHVDAAAFRRRRFRPPRP
jgi:hypothetical protein